MVRVSCCVPGCPVPDDSLRRRYFHKIPLRSHEVWLRKIGREDLLNVDSKFLSWKHLVCSYHFSDEQYCNTVKNEPRKKLRKFAVPDLLPECTLPMEYDNSSELQNTSEHIETEASCHSISLYPKNDDGTQIHADLDVALETIIAHSDKSVQNVTPMLVPEILLQMFVPQNTKSPEILEKVKKKLCRVCGNNELDLIPILEDLTTINLFNIPLIRMMQMYLPVKVDINDPFPLNICIVCLCILKQWHKLYTTCIAADKVFKDTFSQQKCQEESDVQQCSNVTEHWQSTWTTTSLPSDDHDYIKKQSKNEEIKEGSVHEKYLDLSIPAVGEISVKQHKEIPPFKKRERKMKVLKIGGNSSITNEVSVTVKQNTLIPRKKKIHCKNCWEAFGEKKQFYKHIKLCKSGPIICEKCGKVFPSKSTYHGHKYLYHSDMVRMCEKCGKCLPLNKFMNHANSEHPEKHYCELCCRVLRSRKEYNAHMRRHVRGQAKRYFKIEPIFKDKETIFQCPVCTQTFHDKSTMIQHLNEFKSIQCPKCFLKLRNERAFIVHKCKTAMTCQFCFKSFRYKTLLSAHERIHTGEKPIRCQFCNRYFRTQHLKIQHQKIHFAPTYKCLVCSKMFRRPAALRIHEKTHSDKQYL